MGDFWLRMLGSEEHTPLQGAFLQWSGYGLSLSPSSSCVGSLVPSVAILEVWDFLRDEVKPSKKPLGTLLWKDVEVFPLGISC